jgi:tetratricopeptide (TPR) repeat protein
LRSKSQSKKAGNQVALQMNVFYPGFLPSLIELIDLQLELGQSDAALETCSKLQVMDPENIDALYGQILVRLWVKIDFEKASMDLHALESLLLSKEPQNHALYFKIAECLYYVSQNHQGILKTCQRLVEKAMEVNAFSPEYKILLGMIESQLGNPLKAKKEFQLAFSLNGTNTFTFLKGIQMDLKLKEWDAAQAEMDVYQELQSTLDKSSLFHFLKALMARHMSDSANEIHFIQEAMAIHLEKCQTIQNKKPLETLCDWDPFYIVELIQFLLEMDSLDALSSEVFVFEKNSWQ